MKQPFAGAVEVNGKKYPIPALTLKHWERTAAAMADALAGKHELPRVMSGMMRVACLGVPQLSWFSRWPKRELRSLPPQELQRVFEAVLDAWNLGRRK